MILENGFVWMKWWVAAANSAFIWYSGSNCHFLKRKSTIAGKNIAFEIIS
jgi:hypothetical protein